MALSYPESWWSYKVNGVFYWPHRENEMAAHANYVLPRGEHRYFRYNVQDEHFVDTVMQAGAAGVWVRNISCYDAEAEGYKFCEGFLEPTREGVTLGALAEKLFTANLEVSLEPAGFIDEVMQDMDDYLTRDYYSVHPVRMAASNDLLHAGAYYPTTFVYRGQRAGTWKQAPPPETVAKILRERGFGFYQPHEIAETNSVTCILYTGENTTSPEEVATLVNADAAIVNLETLDPDSQAILADQYSGKTAVPRILDFFGKGRDAVSDVGDKLLTIVKYTAIGAGLLGVVWLGLQAYPHMRDAYERAQGRRALNGAQ